MVECLAEQNLSKPRLLEQCLLRVELPTIIWLPKIDNIDQEL